MTIDNTSITSTVEGAAEVAVGGSADPAGLPLFATVRTQPGAGSSGPGRVRGSFTMPDTDTGSAPEPVVGPAAGQVPAWTLGTLHPVPTMPATTGNEAAGTGAGWRESGDLDWHLVASLRQQTADRLSTETSGPLEDRRAQRDRGKTIIADLLGREATERARAGDQAWTPAHLDRLGRAVFDAVFGLGRLQSWVDDDQVENVLINGADRVTLELTGGALVPGPPVADSDEELIDFLAFVATRSEVNARPFSPSQPRLHLRLDGGARLAAAAWVTPRPQVVIRRHRLTQVTLDDLVGLGTMTPVLASFLGAAVKAGTSIVVSGGQGAGKTTVVRALCAQIPTHEVIGTFETEYELHLHELVDRHPHCFAWEARPGSGERLPSGRQAGEFTLGDALDDSFRFNLSRQIVGEVRGPEAMAMLKAMQSGQGSISTTHAGHATGAVEKLITCVMEAGTHATHDFAVRAVAAGINLVVHVTKQTSTARDGTPVVARWVSEVIAVTPGEQQLGYAITHIFRAPPGQSVARPHVLPEEYRNLTAHGFDLAGYYDQQDEVVT